MIYRIVFDAANKNLEELWIPAVIDILFICISWLLVFKPEAMQKLLPYGLRGRARRIMSWVMLIFSTAWLIVTFLVISADVYMAKSDLRNGHYSVVEGIVTHFVPMPRDGHGYESFVVGDRRFSYSDYSVTAGFRNAASHGGPIREGLHVRVSYAGKLILKLEVAD